MKGRSMCEREDGWRSKWVEEGEEDGELQERRTEKPSHSFICAGVRVPGYSCELPRQAARRGPWLLPQVPGHGYYGNHLLHTHLGYWAAEHFGTGVLVLMWQRERKGDDESTKCTRGNEEKRDTKKILFYFNWWILVFSMWRLEKGSSQVSPINLLIIFKSHCETWYHSCRGDVTLSLCEDSVALKAFYKQVWMNVNTEKSLTGLT